MTRLKHVLDPTRIGSDAEQLQASLRARVVGQDDAIEQIVRVYQTFSAGLCSPGRPIANFLFLGPTGTGKTRLVEAVAESLLGDAHAVVKIDCAEFQHSHELAKLIGSPPGYLGHRETRPALSQEVLDRCHTETVKISVVLFDEIEKASDALWNLLLGILDKATLTLGDNRTVDFSRTLIFMTSNLGAAEMASIWNPGLGFSAGAPRPDAASDKVARAGLEAARRKFTPEFLNRIDKTVVFRALGEAELRQILDIELDLLERRILESTSGKPFNLSLTDSAKSYLLAEGTDTRYGARPLKRAMERLLVHPIANLVASGQVRGGDSLCADYDSAVGCLEFYKDAEAARELPAMAAAARTESALAA